MAHTASRLLCRIAVLSVMTHACRVGEIVGMDNCAQLLARMAGSVGNFPMDVSSVQTRLIIVSE